LLCCIILILTLKALAACRLCKHFFCEVASIVTSILINIFLYNNFVEEDCGKTCYVTILVIFFFFGSKLTQILHTEFFLWKKCYMKCGVWNHIFIRVLFIHKTLPWLFSFTFRSLFVNYCMPKTLLVPLAKQEIKETFCVLDNCISQTTLTCVCLNTQLLGFSHNSGFIVRGSA